VDGSSEIAKPSNVAASIERWKHALLDFTKRNRALNFKPNKVSTVTVVDEQPPEVFRLLYVAEESMGFLPAPDPAEPSMVKEARTETWEFSAYERDALPEHHTDRWLQTKLTSADLEKSLRRIDDHARGSLEEQGVNTLFLALGMLYYSDAKDSEQVFRAPLVLLPVRLVRAAANSGLEVMSSDDAPSVNLSLTEYLKATCGIELPAWNETDSTVPDLQQLFLDVAERIRGRPGWRITNEIVLSLFSFEKLVMFKDLEASAAAIAEHPLVQQLVTRQGEAGSGYGLPPDVRDARLDEVLPPERSAHLVPADGSQLRALLAASRGYSLVIEGPPGTGKSQTITNLVAQALADGKSVLFVAEKRAALEVVHTRLTASGLGEFCLAVHSPDANRREVFACMSAALDASAEATKSSSHASERLPELRDTLTRYAETVHARREPVGVSVYDIFGKLAGLADASLVPWDGSTQGVSTQALEHADRCLRDLARAAEPIGDPHRHAWRDVARTSFPELVLQEVLQMVGELDRTLARFETCATLASASLGVPVVDRLANLTYAQWAADVLHRTPGVPPEVLRDAGWNQVPQAAEQLLHELADTQAARASCARRFVPEALVVDHTVDVAYVRGKRGIAAWFAFLDGRYKTIRRRWEAMRVAGYQPTMAEQAEHLDEVVRLQQMHQALHAREWEARSLFGGWWRGIDTPIPALQGYTEWVVEFRGLANAMNLGAIAYDVASHGAADVSAVAELVQLADRIRQLLSACRERLQLPEGYFEGQTVAAIRSRIAELANDPSGAPAWGAYQAAMQATMASVAAAFARRAWAGELAFSALPRVLARSFWSRWLADVVDREPALASFQGLVHEERVAEFRKLDRRVLGENRNRLVGSLRGRLQARLREPQIDREMAVLRPELKKQSRHKPLRRTLLAAGAAARAIHPCWLMSPLSVSQFTPAEQGQFDLVVFDEASQMRPEDAVAAIARGKQLIVVGDPKQLPPTDFFGAQFETTGNDEDDDHPDAASILEAAAGAGLPCTRLKWHYRSAHESLIAFSNEQFYDAELRTFPSVERGTTTAGLRFEHVANGVYEGSGRNRIEAQRVVEAILEFAREQMHKSAQQRWSLGVGTFNLRQRLEIDDLLYERLKDEPLLADFFDRDREEPFFVKNLESIQGDERDAIFLSITYGRTADGSVPHNFGPLNRDGGWKRLNVITTRARKVMRVFSSIRSSDIQPARAKIAPLLKAFLEYAETGRLSASASARRATAESPFEQEVGDELVRRGYEVQPQVGECGYRIDLAVRDPDDPRRYLIGIECDGVAYHSSETARDRDRLREEVLRARGWEIARVWSTDWFKARAAQIDRLVKAIEAARDRRRASALEPEPIPEPVAAPSPTPARETPASSSPSKPQRSSPSVKTTRERGPSVDAQAARAPLPAYEIATSTSTPKGDLIREPIPHVVEALLEVVRVESPIHEDELVTRLAMFWGHNRGGAKIRDHVLRACRTAEQSRKVERRGPFLWLAGSACVGRSRHGNAPTQAALIAPEEYEAIIRHVLANGVTLPREQLVAEVRSALGFQRAGKHIAARITDRLDAMRETGELVEVSLGLRLRVARSTGEIPAAAGPSAVAPEVSTRSASKAWLDGIVDAGSRKVFEHIAVHGTITEEQVVAILGSPREARVFTRQFELHAARAPFTVGIQMSAGIKRYVREGYDA
jgi:very-short-patch-repair endonuclease